MPHLRIAESATLTMPQSSRALSVPRGSKGGRLMVSNTTNKLFSVFDATGGDFQDWHPSWNIKPTQTIPVVLHSATSDEEATNSQALGLQDARRPKPDPPVCTDLLSHPLLTDMNRQELVAMTAQLATT